MTHTKMIEVKMTDPNTPNPQAPTAKAPNRGLKSKGTPRAEDARRKIYDAAMELFREKGFDETSMRDIAAKAGVALGGAYYYFASKDSFVLAFYSEMQENSHQPVLQALVSEKKIKERIRCVFEKRLELLEPNRKFCAALFRHAPDGADPLSPFSEETSLIRNAAIEQMRIAAEDSDAKIPPDLKPRLPYLLWLYQMALIMFWLYDRSPNQQRTKKLLDKSLSLIVSLLRISALPLMKPLRKAVLDLVEAN
ncbi:MAG TPA: TetR family transcriptional regulator [Candidatus Sulfotelmatobacter sp.]|jgi:AcrR family transcriptional regulator|nr:TetR family transcriptional regulator [Candidatus Sulfotelmatobacter sp.]